MANNLVTFENNLANWTTTYMCTPLCPCNPTTTQPALWDDSHLRKFYRTNKAINTNATDPTTHIVYTGFYVNALNYQSSFYNCFQNVLQPQNPSKYTYDQSAFNLL